MRPSVAPTKRPLPVFGSQLINRLEKFHRWLAAHGAEVLICDENFEPGKTLTSFLADGVEYALHTDHRDVLWGTAMPLVECWLHQRPYPLKQAAVVKRRVKGCAEALLARDGPDCFLCGKPLGADSTVEHLLALVHGGSNSLANLALVHSECNKVLGDKSVTEKIFLRDANRKELYMPTKNFDPATDKVARGNVYSVLTHEWGVLRGRLIYSHPHDGALLIFENVEEEPVEDYFDAERSDILALVKEDPAFDSDAYLAFNAHHLNSDKSVAVSDTYRMSKDMTSCPHGAKSLLLGGGGVLVIANYDGDAFWCEWAPFPGRAL